jgi:copper chaperone CopZ
MTETRVFAIDGMTCQNCVRHVQRALASLPGVRIADVNIGSATVSFDAEQLRDENLRDAIQEAGYRVKSTAAA